MAIDTPAKLAILGAGPIGLEAALYARFLGYDVAIFDEAEVAANVRRWGHVRMFTPFGMNRSPLGLAALAAQDENDPGVLVLSRFAGAAAQMRDALIVNPFSQEDVADAIKRALAMPLPERRRRWRALMDGVEKDDIMAWRDSFVAALQEARDVLARYAITPPEGVAAALADPANETLKPDDPKLGSSSYLIVAAPKASIATRPKASVSAAETAAISGLSRNNRLNALLNRSNLLTNKTNRRDYFAYFLNDRSANGVNKAMWLLNRLGSAE